MSLGLGLGVLSGVGFVGVAIAVWLALRRAQRAEVELSYLQQRLSEWRGELAQSSAHQTQMVQDQMHRLTSTVNERLSSVTEQLLLSQRTVGERLDGAARVVGEVQKNLGQLGAASQKIFEVGKDIAGLGDILRSPKLRGGLGEYFLADLLRQILPPQNVTLQHTFRTRETVDAVIRLGDRLVPVDAKFPLENFRRWTETTLESERIAARKRFALDVRKHVDAVATKYILPDEGTYDFALLYIPAENVYYECIVKDERAGEEGALVEYALRQRVVPVSPGSFYAYLQAIVLGLRGFQVEKNAERLLQDLARLEGDFRRFSEDFELVGRHISNARAKQDDASRRLDRLTNRVSQLAQGVEAAPNLSLTGSPSE